MFAGSVRLKGRPTLLTGACLYNVSISLSNGSSFAQEAADNLRNTWRLERVDYGSALLCSPAHC